MQTGVTDYLRFTINPGAANSDFVIENFVDVFERQRNILLSLLDAVGIRELPFSKQNASKGNGELGNAQVKSFPADKVKIFCCYAHEDEQLLNKLKTHLSPLQWQGLIDIWHDRNISAGMEWEQEISTQLNEAQIILLLVSPDFMDSDYCYSSEMKRALERHERREARVIPVILRPTIYWQGVLGKLQALPTNMKPVTGSSWHNLDEAFYDVAEGIRKAVEEISTKPLVNIIEYWNDFANVRRELLSFMEKQGPAGLMPTQDDLKKADRDDLLFAIGKHGGVAVVAERLGLKHSNSAVSSVQFVNASKSELANVALESEPDLRQ